MIFDEENLQIQLLGVFDYYDGKAVSVRVGARPFCALSLRLDSDAQVVLKKEIIALKSRDLAFFPANTPYERQATHDRMIGFHLISRIWLHAILRCCIMCPTKRCCRCLKRHCANGDPECRATATARRRCFIRFLGRFALRWAHSRNPLPPPHKPHSPRLHPILPIRH